MSRDSSPKRSSVSFYKEIEDHKERVFRCIDDGFVNCKTVLDIMAVTNPHFPSDSSKHNIWKLFDKVDDLKMACAPLWPIDFCVRLFVLMCGNLCKPEQISRINCQVTSGARIRIFGLAMEVNSFVFEINDYRSSPPVQGAPWTEQGKHFITELVDWLYLPENAHLRAEYKQFWH